MKCSLALTWALALFITPANSARAEEKKYPLATVTITDVITGMERLEEKKVVFRLNAVGKRGDPMTAPRVLVDESKMKVGLGGKTPMAFVGKLTLSEVVVGMTNSIPPGKITAKTLYLTAEKAADITPENKAQFPAAGMARVQGEVKAGTFAASGVEAKHVILNGAVPILLLKDGKALPEVAGKVVAVGKLRITTNGMVVLDVEKIDEAKEEK